MALDPIDLAAVGYSTIRARLFKRYSGQAMELTLVMPHLKRKWRRQQSRGVMPQDSESLEGQTLDAIEKRSAGGITRPQERTYEPEDCIGYGGAR